MSAQATTQTGSRSLGRIYTLEAKYELLKLLRLPAYLVPTMIFPLAFYLLFGVALRHGSGGTFDLATYLVATYGAFGVMNAALFGFGVGTAMERGQGWMLFKRATPMPPFAWFAGKLAACMACAAVMVASLFTLAATVGGVHLAAGQWFSLAGVLVAGTVPFAAFGLAVGSWVGPNAAPAFINVLALPMAFASGMWFPLQMMPGFVRKIAVFLPPYHFTQLALGRIGMAGGPGIGEPALCGVIFLTVFTAVALYVAWQGYRRDEGKTFG
ncbi:MAG TPA: ABC transporter permease [Thermoanaerobaculia bacterium]